MEQFLFLNRILTRVQNSSLDLESCSFYPLFRIYKTSSFHLQITYQNLTIFCIHLKKWSNKTSRFKFWRFFYVKIFLINVWNWGSWWIAVPTRRPNIFKTISPKSNIPRCPKYWIDSTEKRAMRHSRRLLIREEKRSPRGMNINRFMMGTKWLPKYSSWAKERGFRDSPWMPMFFKKSR